MNEFDPMVNVALSMYLGETCPYCKVKFETQDDLKSAVYNGYTDYGRIAHRGCFVEAHPDFVMIIKMGEEIHLLRDELNEAQDTIGKLCVDNKKLSEERDEARKWARRMYCLSDRWYMELFDERREHGEALGRIRELNDRTYCAYCGAEFLLDGTAASMVTEHIKTCEKHPMRKVEDLLSATELALDASNTHIRQLEREIMELRGTLP